MEHRGDTESLDDDETHWTTTILNLWWIPNSRSKTTKYIGYWILDTKTKTDWGVRSGMRHLTCGQKKCYCSRQQLYAQFSLFSICMYVIDINSICSYAQAIVKTKKCALEELLLVVTDRSMFLVRLPFRTRHTLRCSSRWGHEHLKKYLGFCYPEVIQILSEVPIPSMYGISTYI